jgi:hypothetical protein
MRQHKIPLLLVSAVFCLLVVQPAVFAANGHTKGQEVAPLTKKIKPGEYVWHPEISPSGPVVIVVSLPDQTMYVYRNGVRIGKSTVSTGAKGHSTPTGVFTVLQKKVDHESSIYKGAKMPHMQRLTWGGIAMHAGNLPGYPASHGCVRLPEDFAEKLYSVTSMGTTVIIADNKSAPSTTTNPGLIFAGHKGETAPPGSVIWQPEKAPKGPVSVIVSAADKEGYVYRNGVEIGRAPVGKLGRIRGTHAYSALATVEPDGRRDWLSVGSVGGRTPNVKDLAGRMEVDPDLLAKLRAIITPGTSLIITDMPVNSQTHSRPGFNILTALGPERGH